MFIVEVIPITKSLATPTLSYFSAKDISLGGLVTVPLRSREILAVVVAKHELADMKSLVRNANFQLRNVLTIHEHELFSASLLKAVWKTASYFVRTPGSLLEEVVPKPMLKKLEDFERTPSQKNTVKTTAASDIRLLERTYQERYEYYRSTARELLGNQQSLFITVPTLAIANELYELVSRGIESKSFLLSGTKSSKQLKKIFEQIQKTPHAVIIATPKYLSLAKENTKLFIVEDPSNDAYRTISEPRVDLTVVVELLAQASASSLIYGTSFASIDLWKRVQENNISIIEPRPKHPIQLTKLNFVTFNHGTELQTERERLEELQHTKSTFHPLHHSVKRSLQEAVKNNERIVCFVPRRGIAPNIVCEDCGRILTSKESSLPYSLFTKTDEHGIKEHIYVCNATGEQVPAFDYCPNCSSHRLKQLGIGGHGFAEELQLMFPEVPVHYLDGKTLKTTADEKKLEESLTTTSATIYVGTTKLLSHIPVWDTAIMVTLAPLWSRVSYQNNEEILDLIARFNERTKKRLYLQDRTNYLVHLSVLRGEGSHIFASEELNERKQFGYPPEGVLITVSQIVNRSDAKERYATMRRRYEAYHPTVLVEPRGSNKNIIVLVIKLDKNTWSIHHQDERLFTILQGEPREVTIEVNPKTISSR